MYLVVIAWMYVVLMMAVAEATNSTGTVLGAIVTFFLYGLLPMGIVVYIMSTPARKRKIKAREAAQASEAPSERPSNLDPDTSGHATGGTERNGVAPVGKKP
ncbi:MAG: hypothetical protein WEK74_02855 [Hydrogenophaga sp.]